MPSSPIQGFCPTCNRVSALEVRSEAKGTAPQRLFDELASGEDGLHRATYSTAFCPACEMVFLHVSATSEPSDIRHQTLLYPSSERREISGVPEPARRALTSAQSCYDTGNYDACVVMCRKCVEAVCVHLGARDGTLAKRLRTLKEANRIEVRLYQWAEQLRLVGNDGAHDLSAPVLKQDAFDCTQFVEALFLYVFTLDRSFQEFQARRSSKQ